MAELKLFSSEHCPYCSKVERFMDEKGIEIETEYPHADMDALFAYKELTGKTQVPCLMIDGKALFESDDIISWLSENV